MAGNNWKNKGEWSPWYLLAWGVWVCVSVALFFGLEIPALFDGNEGTPTFTEVVTRWVPGWVVFLGLGAGAAWLGWHFIASYHEHNLLGEDDPEEDDDPDIYT